MKPTYLPYLLSIVFFGVDGIREPLRPMHDKVVACYVASWAAYRPEGGEFLLKDLRPEHCTHLIYAFAGLNVTTWKIRSLDPWADLEKSGIGNYKMITNLRQQYPGLKVSLGIGGWNEGSANYSALASSPERRKIFVSSVIEFLRTYQFSGLDLDWEFPAKRGGAPYDRENFVLLVKELKEAFKEFNFLLTAAISADKSTIDMAYNIPEISKYLDYVHVMAYDYHGAWNMKVLPNAPLKSTDGLAVEDTVKHLLSKGAPASKLVLGLAMYGRTFILVRKPESPEQSPIGLPALEKGFAGNYTREDGFMGYNEICKELSDSSRAWKTGWDEYSQTPYAIKDDHVVVYDNAQSMEKKIDYIKELKFAGVMVWSIDTDDFHGSFPKLHDFLDPLTGVDYPLMRSINMALAKKSDTPDDNTVTSKPNSSSVLEARFNIAFIVFIMFTLFSH